MSKWQIPAQGGHMEKNDGIYFQNMTNLDVKERLKKNDIIMIPIGSTENQECVNRWQWLQDAQWHSQSGMVPIHISIWECREQ